MRTAIMNHTINLLHLLIFATIVVYRILPTYPMSLPQLLGVTVLLHMRVITHMPHMMPHMKSTLAMIAPLRRAVAIHIS